MKNKWIIIFSCLLLTGCSLSHYHESTQLYKSELDIEISSTYNIDNINSSLRIKPYYSPLKFPRIGSGTDIYLVNYSQSTIVFQDPSWDIVLRQDNGDWIEMNNKVHILNADKKFYLPPSVNGVPGKTSMALIPEWGSQINEPVLIRLIVIGRIINSDETEGEQVLAYRNFIFFPWSFDSSLDKHQ